MALIFLIFGVIAMLILNIGSSNHHEKWSKYAQNQEDRKTEKLILKNQNLFGIVVSISTDRNYVLYSSCSFVKNEKSYLHFVDLQTLHEIISFDGLSESVQCLSISPDNTKAVSGNNNGVLRWWNLKTGKEISNAKGHEGYIRSIIYLPGETALSGGDDGNIFWWDLSTMKILKQFSGHSSGVRRKGLAYSESSRRFASGGWNGSVKVWDLETGKLMVKFISNHGRVMALDISPCGKYVIASHLNTMILWDVDQKKKINHFKIPGNPWHTGVEAYISSIAFSGNGKTALFGTAFGSVIWWDVVNWTEIAHNRIHHKRLEYVFCGNNKDSISVGCDSDSVDEDAKIIRWSLPSMDTSDPDMQ